MALHGDDGIDEAPKITAEFSPDSLRMFAELLGQFSIPSSHPQLVLLAQQTATAREELQVALVAGNRPKAADD